jgi:thioredoxin 1
MVNVLNSLKETQEILEKEAAVLIYFSAPSCNVCHVLKPKVFEATKKYYEKMHCTEVNIANTPDIGVHFNVLSAPTVIIFLNGKEFVRESRAFSVEGMFAKVERPYEILFS